ncbi:MAG: hypothetical protein ACJ8G3_22280 [Burkholderiaceae bacterium]
MPAKRVLSAELTHDRAREEEASKSHGYGTSAKNGLAPGLRTATLG